ncbi:hypothetical protein FCV25MIE_15347, partial [Fagus crenata]
MQACNPHSLLLLWTLPTSELNHQRQIFKLRNGGIWREKSEGSPSLEVKEVLRKWAILRVGFPPADDTMSSSLSRMTSFGSTILGVS